MVIISNKNVIPLAHLFSQHLALNRGIKNVYDAYDIPLEVLYEELSDRVSDISLLSMTEK